MTAPVPLFARLFGRPSFLAPRQATIYESRLKGEIWTPPRVASFSGVYSDIDLFISPDGTKLKLYFSSIRPVNGEARSDTDLWMVKRSGGGWRDTVHLGISINSTYDELYPSVDDKGVLYFGSDCDFIDSVAWDIFRALPKDAGAYGLVEGLPGGRVNSDAWEYNPTITKDGTTLIFVSQERAGRFGAGDIYMSRLENHTWTQAHTLEKLSTRSPTNFTRVSRLTSERYSSCAIRRVTTCHCSSDGPNLADGIRR